uniref:T9SS type A sorting domain-containing protein n=1 Tax=Polaribacter sp. TaxID=1920175 RepID=UPI0040472363
GTIIMQSSATTSAALKAGTIAGSGTYKYQKYVAGSSTNDLISAPFSGETFSNLIGNNSGVLRANPSLTTQYLFGPFDNDTGAYLTYDSTTNASTVLSAGQGYRAGTANGATLEFTGTYQTTDQTVAINVGSHVTYGKWNLVGNPFPTYLDLDGFISDNSAVLEDVNTAVYAYDGDVSNGSNWTIYHSSNSSGVTIAPGQAFFVASSSGGGNLTFNKSRQTVAGGDDFLLSQKQNKNKKTQTLDSFFKLNMQSNNSLTHTDVYFNSNASEGLDIGYDVGTYANQASSFSLYSKLASGEYSDTKFAVQTISNDLSETVVIPLGVHTTSAGENHLISIEDVSILESVNVYLKDYETGALTLLNNGAYSFSTDSTLEGTSRFELRLTNTTLGIESDELITNFKAIYQNHGVILVGDFMLEDKVEIYDIMGRLTQTHTIGGNHSIEISKDELPTGVYLAKINREGNSKTIKFIIN